MTVSNAVETTPPFRNREFALNGINHLALVCSDMDRTVDFYTNVLGMPLVKTIDAARRRRPALLLRSRRRRLPRLLLVP